MMYILTSVVDIDIASMNHYQSQYQTLPSYLLPTFHSRYLIYADSNIAEENKNI